MKIKTPIETLSKFIGAAVWADGKFDESEVTACQKLAEVLEIDGEKFVKLVRESSQDFEDFDVAGYDNDLNEYLWKIRDEMDIDKDEAYLIYECALETILFDDKIRQMEIVCLYIMAYVLDIEEHNSILMFCHKMNEISNLKILPDPRRPYINEIMEDLKTKLKF